MSPNIASNGLHTFFLPGAVKRTEVRATTCTTFKKNAKKTSENGQILKCRGAVEEEKNMKNDKCHRKAVRSTGELARSMNNTPAVVTEPSNPGQQSISPLTHLKSSIPPLRTDCREVDLVTECRKILNPNFSTCRQTSLAMVSTRWNPYTQQTARNDL